MMNALYAVTHVIIVTRPEPFCLDGVLAFGKILRMMKDSANGALRLAGVLINGYTPDSAGHIKAEAALRQWSPEFIYQTKIRQSRPLYNSVLAHQDIFSFWPECNGAIDYGAFVDESLSKIK